MARIKHEVYEEYELKMSSDKSYQSICAPNVHHNGASYNNHLSMHRDEILAWFARTCGLQPVLGSADHVQIVIAESRHQVGAYKFIEAQIYNLIACVDWHVKLRGFIYVEQQYSMHD